MFSVHFLLLALIPAEFRWGRDKVSGDNTGGHCDRGTGGHGMGLGEVTWSIGC